MLAGVLLFSFMDAGLKALSATYSPLEVTALRALASLPFIVVSIAWTRRWRQLRVSNPLVYAVRAAIGVLMVASFVFAVSRQGLADAYAVFMSAPLMVAALSRIVLKDPVPLRRWVAITVGLVGVLVALKPRGAGLVSVGGIAAMVSAICYAGNVLSIRWLGRYDSSHALVFWNLLGIAVLATGLASPSWMPIEPHHFGWLVVVGVTGALAQHLLTSAFQLAPPATVAPFEYTALVWGLALDDLIFSIAPLPNVLLGGAIVIGSGLFVIWDERRRSVMA
jgi:drug/metabolite transporter (DMT)-like permease